MTLVCYISSSSVSVFPEQTHVALLVVSPTQAMNDLHDSTDCIMGNIGCGIFKF